MLHSGKRNPNLTQTNAGNLSLRYSLAGRIP